MSDVNPNQDLRFKEILKTLLPGGYLLAFVFLAKEICKATVKSGYEQVFICLSDASPSTAYTILLLVAFMTGYVNHFMASAFERIMYFTKILPRPSKIVLNGCKCYRVDHLGMILEEFKPLLFNGHVCQSQAAIILSSIKSRITRKDNLVEDFYHRSIMGRNFFSAQFWATTFCLTTLDGTFNSKFLLTSTVLLVIFFAEWYRQNCVYVKNIFQEYIIERNQLMPHEY